MIGLTFFFATTIFVVITWIVFFYGIITKKIKKSTIYGFLAVSYISHALSCEIISIPYLFYFGFSVFFLAMFSIYKKVENKVPGSDINKKEKDSDE